MGVVEVIMLTFGLLILSYYFVYYFHLYFVVCTYASPVERWMALCAIYVVVWSELNLLLHVVLW